MATDLHHVVLDVLRAAQDAEPLSALTLGPKLRGPERFRLQKAETLLQHHPSPDAVELYLKTLIETTRRVVNAQVVIRRAFADAVNAIDNDTLKALPPKVRDVLGELANVALKCESGVPVIDAHLFAHGIRVRGRSLIAAVAQELGIERDDVYSVEECRREMMRSHPDKGGDREAFELWHARYERARRVGA